MLKRLTFLPALVVATSLAWPLAAQAQDVPDKNMVIAKVGDTEITVGHVVIAMATLPEQYQQLPSNVLFDGILEQLVQQTLLMQSLDGQSFAHVELSLDNERRSLMAGQAMEEVMADAVTEETLAAAYEEAYSDAKEFKAAHILVDTEEEANAIKAELDEGADFAETAKANSTGPSGPNGGNLGWFGAGRMVPEFEEAVLALEPGQISDPVQTQFGWHVIILNETRALQPDMASVEAELADGIRRQAVEDHVASLMEGASVERPDISGLNPDALRNLDIVMD